MAATSASDVSIEKLFKIYCGESCEDHQIMVTYPVNGKFLCLGNGCSSISAPV